MSAPVARSMRRRSGGAPGTVSSCSTTARAAPVRRRRRLDVRGLRSPGRDRSAGGQGAARRREHRGRGRGLAVGEGAEPGEEDHRRRLAGPAGEDQGVAGVAEAAGGEAERGRPLERLEVLVAGAGGDGDGVPGRGVEEPSGENEEAAVVAPVADDPGARDRRGEVDRRRRRPPVHEVVEGDDDGAVDGDVGGAVGGAGGEHERGRRRGDVPVVVEAVHRPAGVAHPGIDVERVLRRRPEDGAAVLEDEARRGGQPGHPAGRPRLGGEGGVEVAAERRVDAEAAGDRGVVDGVVEDHLDRGVGDDARRPAGGVEGDDLRRRTGAGGQQRRRQAGEGPGGGSAPPPVCAGRQRGLRSACSTSMPGGDPAPALTSIRAGRSAASRFTASGDSWRSRWEWV